jgi:uncharacterized protein (DUF488 family)
VRIFTIGHSNQALIPFLDALRGHEIELLADVRRHPVSRRHPHFGRTRLVPALQDAAIDYLHIPELGGHREPRPDSRNTGLRDPVFRGYADHMESAEFAAGMTRLLEAGAVSRTAIMCAERKWTDCHRQFIADVLRAQGHDVIHILSADTCEPHVYTKAARIVNGAVSYAGLL